MKRKITSTKSIFKYERTECPVCMEEMNIESRSVTSPCMHEFCLECIGKWLTESSSSLCPLCKQSVKIIIYNIQTPSKYSKINFPKGFNNAWLLRNKTKNILDNFENILFKIYDTIRTFIYGKKLSFDIKILDYLVYFGGLLYRPKSRPPNVFTSVEINEDAPCWHIVEKLIEDRLLFLYSHHQSIKILKEIKDKKCYTLRGLLAVLVKYLDPIRFEAMKFEITTHLKICLDSSLYLEYYIPGDHEHIIFTKDSLSDECIASAIITRIITSINFETPNMVVAGYQISNIDHIFTLLDYICSYEKLLLHLGLASYYILSSTNFYSANVLKRADSNMSHITISSCDLIKHCFREEELDHIAQTLSKFEKRYIFFEPLIVDDSNLSDTVFEEYRRNIYIELSDSDDDALEIISINRPVLDLTATSDDDLSSVHFEDTVPIKKSRPTYSHREHREDDNEEDNLSKIIELYHSVSKDEPTTSTISFPPSEIIIPSANENLPLSVGSDLSDESLRNIDCLSDEDTDASFIYQPRSVNDFYEYLMSKNLPNN